jgi:hypothetical protein
MSKLAVGTPISRLFDWRTVKSFFSFINEARGDIVFITRGQHERPMAIETAREEIAQQVLDQGHEWLLWFDSDATAAPGTLTRLWSWDKPLISALCFKRKRPVTAACGILPGAGAALRPTSPGEFTFPPPTEAVEAFMSRHLELADTGAYILPEAPPDALLPVNVMGTHCTLVHRDVLAAVAQPRFERWTPPGTPSTGSDWSFCVKAQRAGYQPYVDLSVISGHLDGSHEIAGIDAMAWTMWLKWTDRFNLKQEEINALQ